MRAWISAIEANVLLLRFVESDNEKKADALLERLLNGHATPLIRNIVARKTTDAVELEQVAQLASIRMLSYLRHARVQKQRNAVQHFKAFVTRLAEQAFGDFLDAKYPERRRLKDRLRYALRHQGALAEWYGNDGRMLCGLATWKTEDKSVQHSARYSLLLSEPHTVAEIALIQSDPWHVGLPELVVALLRWIGTPLSVEEMVGCLARIQGIAESTVSLTSDEEDDNGQEKEILDPGVNLERDMQHKAWLQQIWEEIGRLPIRQRIVLLLGLKDAAGNGMLELFMTMHIATLREIASSLDMEWETFASLWKELPLDDKRIAVLLKISPENVRFQRNAARNRLRQRQDEEQAT